MNRLAIRTLRVALVVFLLVSVLVQVLVPVWASGEGTRVPEVEYLVIPYSLAAMLFIGCGQLVLLAVWRLLSFVGEGIIFTRRAVRWVDVIIVCAAVAATLTAIVLVHMLGFVPSGGGPDGLPPRRLHRPHACVRAAHDRSCGACWRRQRPTVPSPTGSI